MTKQELLSKHAKQRENLQKKFEKLDKEQIRIWNAALGFLEDRKSRHKNRDISLHYESIIRAVRRYTKSTELFDENNDAFDIEDDYWVHKFELQELQEKQAKLLERQRKEAAKFVDESPVVESSLDDDEVIESLSAGHVVLVFALALLGAVLYYTTV